ncbi:hydrolase 1, exosortase A system-associated [Azohydromonas lata]|uniref:hydrolase 1, exosortase A system-associated n=1 Tax=Azohydromonas lata TaxID=45677 RepID=UPI000A02B5EB|nr:hydrolase 1, exosortase A system-associated [Azohydromonas lata]
MSAGAGLAGAAPAWEERALAFDCRGQQLIGVLAVPAGAATAAVDTGVVIVTGGPQYRAGAHRVFVCLARALAGAGVAALRFDLRGMGDSEGDFPGFEHVAPDVAAAVDALQAQCPGLRRVLLWGLCDGASAALLYLHATRDARVRGLCLLNPWVRSAQSLARAHVKHYYLQRLLQGEFWRKLLRGGVGLAALGDLAGNLRGALGRGSGGGAARGDGQGAAPASYQQRMAQAWRGFDGEVLLLIAGQDLTGREFLEHAAADAHWRGLLQRPGVRREDCAGADHTFSSEPACAWLLQRTLAWVRHGHAPLTSA